jgi:hypothetical protein
MSSYTLPSLYIPFVFTQTTEEEIIKVIEVAYELGKVAYIDRILREDVNGSFHNSIYVHFETFNFNEVTERFLEHAKDKNDPPRLYYQYGKPWFWKVMLNTKIGKYELPHAKVDHNLPNFVRPDFQNPSEEMFVEPSLPVAPSLSFQVAPDLPIAPSLFFQVAPALPVAPSLSCVFPEILPPLKLPEECDVWYDNVSDLSEPFLSVPTTPREKTIENDRFKFVPRVLALRKSENIVNDCLYPIVIPNQRDIANMETQYEYQEGESILLSRLMKIVSDKREEEQRMTTITDDNDDDDNDADEYEGSSEEATQSECSDNSTNFEGSSNNANLQYIQSQLVLA